MPRDRDPLATLLRRTDTFTADEVDVALELIDDSINRSQSSGYECVVACEPLGDGDDEAVMGYLSYGRTPMTEGTYDLYWVAVDPTYRGKGVGKALCRAFEETVRQRDGHLIRVETSSQEAYGGTVQFYTDAGYIEGGRLPGFYKPGDDLIILYRTI